MSAADLKAANERSQSAIRRATNLQNALGKYFTPAGVRIGTRQPPGVIRQDAGTGQNGLPTSTILNGAITNPKLANEAVNSEKIAPGGVTSGDLANNSVTGEKISAGAVTSAKVAAGAIGTAKIADDAVNLSRLGSGQRQYWAAVTGGIPPVVTAQSDPAGGITALRINQGNYRVDFGTDISACSFTASVASDISGTAPISAQVATDATDNQRVAVRTVDGTNTPRDAGNFQVQVLC